MTRGTPLASLAFLAAVLFHDPLIPLLGTSVVAHALLGLGGLVLLTAIVSEARVSARLHWIAGPWALAAIAPLAIIGALYALLDRGGLSVQLQFLTTFVLVPMMWYALSSLAQSEQAARQLGSMLLAYMAIELLIMLLQISFFLTGTGIAPSETYEFMIAGSQFNQNNLAGIVVTLSIFYNATQGQRSRWHRRLFNLVVLLILLITFSRLAMLLYIADRLRKITLRNLRMLLALTATLIGTAFALSTMDYTGNETIDASLYKAKSLATIAEVGLAADSSTSSRSESYLNFVDKLGELGFGSGEILNYSRFTRDALFSDEAIYVNPHSMLIEVGYWMGWPGLFSLLLFLMMLYGRGSQGSWATRIFIITAVLLISSIPSSAIPLTPLWLGMLMLAMLGEFSSAPAVQPIQAVKPKVAYAH